MKETLIALIHEIKDEEFVKFIIHLIETCKCEWDI